MPKKTVTLPHSVQKTAALGDISTQDNEITEINVTNSKSQILKSITLSICMRAPWNLLRWRITGGVKRGSIDLHPTRTPCLVLHWGCSETPAPKKGNADTNTAATRHHQIHIGYLQKTGSSYAKQHFRVVKTVILYLHFQFSCMR